ncbi:hypothetical protein P3G55_04730 [Leptospira sp. 96542]|nr:hypothetical protein [Leptospira sp. 96542]
MNLRNWLRAQYPYLFTDEPESVILENKICNLFQEVRKKEETILPRMSNDFDTRLLNVLQSTPIEAKNLPVSATLREWFENRSVQYSFSAVMALSLVFVLVGRMNQDQTPVSDSAGVVIEQNTSYMNEPASIDMSENYQKRMLVDHLRSNPDALGGLKELETYYTRTGRESAAEEIHFLIESVER